MATTTKLGNMHIDPKLWYTRKLIIGLFKYWTNESYSSHSNELQV